MKRSNAKLGAYGVIKGAST